MVVQTMPAKFRKALLWSLNGKGKLYLERNIVSISHSIKTDVAIYITTLPVAGLKTQCASLIC